MKMKLIAAGAAMAMAAPFAAVQAADAEWYGRIHLSVDHYTDLDGRTLGFDASESGDDGAGDEDTWAEANEGTYFANNSSRFGFRGSVEAGDLTLLGQIESSVPVGGNWTANRDTFVGMEGGFGKVLVGMLPAGNQFVYDVNFFADQVGDAGLFQAQGDGASQLGGRTTALWYGNEIVDGLNVGLTYLPSGEHGEDTGVGLRAHYAMGDMGFGLTHFGVEDIVGADITALSFKMDYGMGELGVSYTSFSAAADDMDNATLVLGGSFRLSDEGTLKAQYQTVTLDGDGDDPSVISLGYDHKMSSNVTAYAAYAMGSDADVGAVSQWGHGTPGDFGYDEDEGDVPTGGADTSVISFGMLYNF